MFDALRGAYQISWATRPTRSVLWVTSTRSAYHPTKVNVPHPEKQARNHILCNAPSSALVSSSQGSIHKLRDPIGSLVPQPGRIAIVESLRRRATMIAAVANKGKTS